MKFDNKVGEFIYNRFPFLVLLLVISIIAVLFYNAVTLDGRHRQKEWTTYKLKHQCALVASAETASLEDRQAKEDGDVKLVLLSTNQMAYRCNDGVYYINDN